MTATMSKSFDTKRLYQALAVLLFAFLLFAPVPQAHAQDPTPTTQTDNGNIGKVDVGIDDKGQLTISGGGFKQDKGGTGVWVQLFEKYRGLIVGISGLATISMILFFVMYLTKLGASAGNASARREAIQGCLWTIAATVGLGSVTLFAGFFYNLLN